MLKIISEKKYEIKILVIGILGSYIAIISGAYFDAVLSCIRMEKISVLEGLKKVFSNSIEKYYTENSIVWMILFCLCFISGFYFFLLSAKKKTQEKMIHEDVSNGENIQVKEVDIFKEAFEGNVEPESYTENKSSIYEESAIFIPDEKEATFSNDIVMELLGEYDMEQIMAMLNLSSYMENVTADILRKMFNPSMSSEDIKSYIEMFYE